MEHSSTKFRVAPDGTSTLQMTPAEILGCLAVFRSSAKSGDGLLSLLGTLHDTPGRFREHAIVPNLETEWRAARRGFVLRAVSTSAASPLQGAGWLEWIVRRDGSPRPGNANCTGQNSETIGQTCRGNCARFQQRFLLGGFSAGRDGL